MIKTNPYISCFMSYITPYGYDDHTATSLCIMRRPPYDQRDQRQTSMNHEEDPFYFRS